jgi:hypothetical protein
VTRESVPSELTRARRPTAFTPLLDHYLRRHRALYCVCLVDGEGECVDDASRLLSDDSALIGATWNTLRPVFAEHASRLGGDVYFWTVDTARHAYGVRRVSPELSLVVAGGPAALDRRVVEELHRLAEDVREESGAHTESGDFWGHSVEVEVRASRRWGYAPLRYVDRGREVGPLEVLGRYSELWAGVTRVCFLVRDDRGDTTLCHDTELNRWFLR